MALVLRDELDPVFLRASRGLRVSLRPIWKKTPFELWTGPKTNISYCWVFGCKCFVLNESDRNTQIYPKSLESGQHQ